MWLVAKGFLSRHLSWFEGGWGEEGEEKAEREGEKWRGRVLVRGRVGEEKEKEK